MTRIHHLDCGPMRPAGGWLVDGHPGLLRRSEMACHCLLVESDAGLVLVDTGMGTHGASRPRTWLGNAFTTVMSPRATYQDSALAQVRALGYQPDDLRHIVLTHLDLDHAGGLADFPHARVHVYAEEYRALVAPRTRAQRARYRPAQFAHGPQWSTYATDGDDWFGFRAVRELDGLGPDFLLVPLAGHTEGHAGVAVNTGASWLLHAGDAYFHHGEMDPAHPHCPTGISAFQTVMQTDRAQRLRNQRRLRDLRAQHGADIAIFSAHDPAELPALRSQTSGI